MRFPIFPNAIRDYLRWLNLRRLFPNTEIAQSAVVSIDCNFADHVVIYPDASVIRSSIGRFSYIGSNSRITDCNIGSFCSIAPGVTIGGYLHPTSKFVSTSPAFFSTKNQSGKFFVKTDKFVEQVQTKLGNDIWVGYEAIILPGITISDGAIIAAGAVVSRDVGAYEIVAGTPARVMRKRFSDDQIARLLQVRWWEKDEDWLAANGEAFDNIENFLTKL